MSPIVAHNPFIAPPRHGEAVACEANFETMPLAWPLLLSKAQLCAYLCISVVTLGRICPVPPLVLGVRLLRWRRTDIDDWVSGIPTRHRPGEETLLLPSPRQLAGETRRSAAVDRVRQRAARSEKRQWPRKKDASRSSSASRQNEV